MTREPEDSTPDADTVPATSVQNAAAEETIDLNSSAARCGVNAALPLSLVIYSRAQLVRLYDSPLVQPPPCMPALKDWFGLENAQNLTKKDPETSNSPSARDRRFRRDQEDGEIPSRSVYRATLTQPSQMGNFKHQSSRSNERDREHANKDRERDLRDKEGQERLRNLSDKYDRDRLAVPSHLISLRNSKQKDSAPQASAGSHLRLGGQAETAMLRKSDPNHAHHPNNFGEAGEEDLVRSTHNGSGNDDGRNRDESERLRSQIRNSDQPRREPSTSRRDRFHDQESNREELREWEIDDPRRWRDDGRLEEKGAARRDRHNERDQRDRDRLDRIKERERTTWDTPDRNDRRLTVLEERDARSKRSSGRERKTGGVADEGKMRDDPREREREKEPAWMDASIPSGSGTGILGGKGPDGELDRIQAWKRGMKEKEQKGKASTSTMVGKGEMVSQGADNVPIAKSHDPLAQSDEPLNDIQLIRLMMAREEEKRKSGNIVGTVKQTPGAIMGSTSGNFQSTHVSPLSLAPVISPTTLRRSSPPLDPAVITSVTADSHPLSGHSSVGDETTTAGQTGVDIGTLLDGSKGSRLFSNPLSLDLAANVAGADLKSPTSSLGRTSPTQFRPSQGSRLFPSGARESPTTPQSASIQSTPTSNQSIPSDGNVPGHKGSRFAKFFDGRNRDAIQFAKGSGSLSSSSVVPGQRQDGGSAGNMPTSNSDVRTMNDIFAMLHSSAQAQGLNQVFNGNAPTPQNLLNHHLLAHLPASNRLDGPYNHLEDRSSNPDDAAPALRRLGTRGENIPMYPDRADDSRQHLMHGIPQRGLDQMLTAPHPSLYAQQGLVSGNNVATQPLRRGAPSPIHSQSTTELSPTQRLPPGLANLGGRPPHEPTHHYLNGVGLPLNTMLGSTHANGNAQQYGNLGTGALGYGGMQMRRVAPALHHLQHAAGQTSMPGSLVGSLELGAPHQAPAQELNNGLRNGGAFHPQQGLSGLAHMRQQQQHPAHMMPHVLTQQYHSLPDDQGTHDLMALLMGGHRG